MTLPHSPPPSRDGAGATPLIFHDACELPLSPTTSCYCQSGEDASTTNTNTVERESDSGLEFITSPPYWLSLSPSTQQQHEHTVSSPNNNNNNNNTFLSPLLLLGANDAGITLLDNTESEEGQRKNSGCWARAVKIEDFVVCAGNKVVVAGGRGGSERLMELGNGVSRTLGLSRLFNGGGGGGRGGGEVMGERGNGNSQGDGSLGGLGRGFGAFVVWNVEVETLEGGSIHIRKRYSEFESLRERLLMTFPNSTAAMPPLPPKSVISKFRPRFLEHRRVGLVYFLNCILLNPEFSGSPVLKDFLFS